MIPFTPVPWAEYVAYPLAWIVFLVYAWIVLRKKKLITDWKVFVKFFLIIFACFWLGARVWYFVRGFITRGVPLADYTHFFDVYYGGNVSIGAIIGGVLGLILASRLLLRNDSNYLLKFSKIADELVLPALIFGAIVRIGCLLDGHVLGKQTNLPWALQYPGEAIGRHPVAAYDLVIFLLIFVFIFILFGHEKTEKIKLGKRYDAQVLCWFILLFCVRSRITSFYAERSITLFVDFLIPLVFLVMAFSIFMIKLFSFIYPNYRTYLSLNHLIFSSNNPHFFEYKFLYLLLFHKGITFPEKRKTFK